MVNDEKYTAQREPVSDSIKVITSGDDDYVIKNVHKKQKPPLGSHRNDGVKYTEGGGNDHLTKNICGKSGAE